MHVRLRPVEDRDLPLIFEQQRDPASNAMAGVPARDREAFDAHWRRLRADPACVLRVVEADGRIVGHAVSFPRDDARSVSEGEDAAGGRVRVREVGYWIDRAWWGRGVATRALALLVREIPERPLHAKLLASNVGSARVLEKNGFVLVEERGGEERYRLD